MEVIARESLDALLEALRRRGFTVIGPTIRDQAIVGYRQTVQTAFREVHDALVVHRTAREILVAESARRDQLASALEVANLRYDAGRTSFLEVLDAQRQLLSAETQRIAAARDTQIAIVSFARALGGGWEPATLADAMP